MFMPARLRGAGERGVKVVSVFPGNRGRGLPAISGAVLMLDDETGAPQALMDAGELTAIRTAAAAGLAARLLSRPESRVLAVFGAGAQAVRHVEAIRAVRPVEDVRVVSRGGGGNRPVGWPRRWKASRRMPWKPRPRRLTARTSSWP